MYLMFLGARIYLNCIDNVDRQISGISRNRSIPSKPKQQCFLHNLTLEIPVGTTFPP